jgi:hypothetical protein
MGPDLLAESWRREGHRRIEQAVSGGAGIGVGVEGPAQLGDGTLSPCESPH